MLRVIGFLILPNKNVGNKIFIVLELQNPSI